MWYHRFRRPGAYLAGSLVCAALLGCPSFRTTAPVTVRLPPVPAHWSDTFLAVGFEIEWPGCEKPVVVSPGVGQVVVELPKRGHLAVLAAPAAAGARGTLRVAGAIYPLHLNESEVLPLTWEDGALASVVARLDRAGAAVELLNVGRLGEEMAERAGGDPWALDLERIAAELAGGEFTAVDIRLAEAYPVELPLPQGRWFAAAAYAPLLHCDGSVAPVVELPAGLHPFYRVGAGTRWLVAVEEGGRWFVGQLDGEEPSATPGGSAPTSW
jgi:hypothetical protein